MGDKLGDDGGRRNRKLFPETCLATFNSADLNLGTALKHLPGFHIITTERTEKNRKFRNVTLMCASRHRIR
jgi:hypothetical protein